MGGVAAAVQKTYDVVVKNETPTAPALPPPPPPPGAAGTPEAAAKSNEAADNERKARGRASTMLTGSGGVGAPATTSRRTLLGS